jgi:hypothetical protein
MCQKGLKELRVLKEGVNMNNWDSSMVLSATSIVSITAESAGTARFYMTAETVKATIKGALMAINKKMGLEGYQLTL